MSEAAEGTGQKAISANTGGGAARHALSTGWAAAGCAAIAFATYANTLWFSFAYDDQTWIVNNPAIRSLRNLPRFFGAGQLDKRTYRPLVEAWFALDYALVGLRPWVYHLENILLHAGITVLLYRLFARVAPRVAPLAAALFAVVAVHSEAVANVTGRSELLACFLGLLALYFVERPLVAALFLFAGLFAKETPVVIPALALVMWWKPAGHGVPPTVAEADGCGNGAGARAASPAISRITPTAHAGEAARAPARLFRRLLVLSCLAIAILAFAAIRHFGAHCCELFPADYVNAPLDNPAYGIDWASRLRTGLMLLAQNLVICIVPYHLSADYSLAQIVPVGRWLEPVWILWAALLAAIVCAGWMARRRFPNVARGLAWFLAAAVPVSNLIVPIGTIRAERLLYLASAGVCLAAAELLLALGRRRRLIWVLIGALVFAEGLVAARRNLVWRRQGTLVESMVADAPRSARSHCSLALLLAATGHRGQALAEFQRAIEIYPAYFAAWEGQATCYRDLGDLVKAESSVRTALAIAPSEVGATQLLADICGRQGDGDCVASTMTRLVGMNREAAGDPGAWMTLGNAAARADRLPEAERAFRQALLLGAGPSAHLALASVLEREGRLREALVEYRAAAAGVTNEEFFVLWAEAERRAGHVEAAREVARRGLQRYPQSRKLQELAR